jgi:hypothetical protein
MFATARRLPTARVANRRCFHASAPAFVKVGDKLPDVDLVEGSPGNKVNLAKELTGKGVIIGQSRRRAFFYQKKTSTDNYQVSPRLFRPRVPRTIFPATLTPLSSKMPGRSLLSR